MKSLRNQVLQDRFTKSANFYESDLILQHFLQNYLSKKALQYLQPSLTRLGKQAASEMDTLSLEADKNTPQLIKRNFYGEDIDQVKFHPSYWQLMQIAATSEMFRVKWLPENKTQFQKERHLAGFAPYFLYTMAEGGIPCPLCMTDGVARLIDRYCTEADKARLLPHIYATNLEDFFTGAMFLTEKAGGSDVGANLVTATHKENDYYLLNGEKWFCSNVNADIIFVLARTNPAIQGTKGLSIFLVEKTKPDGTKNPLSVVRLKDKLGVRSMASAECMLQDTWGKLVGKEGEGFKIMTDMINLSRVYNAMTAVAFMRRALVEVYQFLSYRITFGTEALDHGLIRQQLAKLHSLYLANFYLTWHTVKILDQADNGDPKALALSRFLTPMIKKCTAETGVYVIRESMELMGGMGYIEDGMMPKLMRDMMVLPIWEGAGNIMVLDMLRASSKSEGLQYLLQDVVSIFNESEPLKPLIAKVETLQKHLGAIHNEPWEVLSCTAKDTFAYLTQLVQIAFLQQYKDEQSNDWLQPAQMLLIQDLDRDSLAIQKPLEKVTVQQMLGWIF
ncbi:MAG: acyl-CoA dehydrogenase family protein [Thermonemataceae bacterium]